MKPGKKLIIINILNILNKYSDSEHRLSQKDILDILEKEYSMKIDRKAINRNIDKLIEAGYRIECEAKPRKLKNGKTLNVRKKWYMEREFTDCELRILIDSILFSKHIPSYQCKELVEKIINLSNSYFSAKVDHISNLPENFPQNKELFYTVEILDDAISKQKKVVFNYTDFKIDKERYLREDKDGNVREYVVNPYQIVATNGRYYLICNYDKYDSIDNYRIDRIKNIKILDEDIKEISQIEDGNEKLDLPQHMAEHIYMFSGKSAKVDFVAEKTIINDIIDWFGTDVCFSNETKKKVDVSVTVNERAMLYWAMQYGKYVEIKKPESLRKELKRTIKKMAEKYTV